MIEMLDFGTVAACMNILLAVVAVWMMQCVARDVSTKTILGRIKLSHRIAFAVVGLALASNGGASLIEETAPRVVDFATELSLLLVLLISARRHNMAATPPALPGGQQP